ncbi:MAG: HU family DNA-binding protein [Patescibacteria group bacterium]|nr:HU family DNA-binding protein [Patescibacteria group bacterium]MCL5258113.1 HU family DNA-binding protein [Patescibacteria group bacterium]
MAQPTVKREDLAKDISEKLDLSKKTAVDILNHISEFITANLKKGVNVKFAGLGTFKVRDRKAREALNPRTGEKVQVPATRVARFTPAKELKEAVKS